MRRASAPRGAQGAWLAPTVAGPTRTSSPSLTLSDEIPRAAQTSRARPRPASPAPTHPQPDHALRCGNCGLPQPQALLPIPKALLDTHPAAVVSPGLLRALQSRHPIPGLPLLRGLLSGLLPRHQPVHPDPAALKGQPLRPVDNSLQPEPLPRLHRELREQEVLPLPGHPGPGVDPNTEVRSQTGQKPGTHLKTRVSGCSILLVCQF